MRVVMMPVGKVKPYERNPRVNEGAAVAKVAASLKEFGWRQAIVVDEDLVILAGHTRLKAALSLGMEQVPVHVAKGLTPEQARAYRIADNRVAEESDWDRALLTLELGEMKAAGVSMDPLGFDDNELASLMGIAVDPAGEWRGMPEFDQPDATAFRDIIMHFPDQAAVDAFAKVIGQVIAPKAKFLWYPEAERGTYSDKRYASEGAGAGAAEGSAAQGKTVTPFADAALDQAARAEAEARAAEEYQGDAGDPLALGEDAEAEAEAAGYTDAILDRAPVPEKISS